MMRFIRKPARFSKTSGGHYVGTAVLLASLLFAITVWSQTPKKPAGSGTKDDPCRIGVFEELLWIAADTANWGKSYVQTADINAVQTRTLDGGAGWTPIGTNLQKYFTGSYNGCGFDIDSLYINRPATDYIGLFGYIGAVGSGNIDSVNLNNCDITGDDKVGGLVGLASGRIRDCSVKGSIAGSEFIGGLAGYNWGNIANSHALVRIDGYTDAGCLVGLNEPNSKIISSYAEGRVETSGWNARIGGLVGTNYGTIDRCHATTTLEGSEKVGGLVGENTEGIIRNSFANVDIECQTKAGGLAGNNSKGTIINCHAEGSIKYPAVGLDLGVLIGGLTGWSDGNIDSCHAGVRVEGIDRVGGLAGASGGNVSRCYSSDSIFGRQSVGGLIGYNSGNINSSYSDASVSGDSLIGGLTGYNSVSGEIINSYAAGSVAGNVYIGGLSGYSSGRIIYAYAVGKVDGDSLVGGLVGGNTYNDTKVHYNSFWDIATTGQTKSHGGIAATTAAMKNIITYFDTVSSTLDSVWDFENVWGINGKDNDGYPFLRWQGYDIPATISFGRKTNGRTSYSQFALGVPSFCPHSGAVRINISVPAIDGSKTHYVEIRMYNYAGRLAGIPVQGWYRSGIHTLMLHPKRAAPGIYTICLSADGTSVGFTTLPLLQ